MIEILFALFLGLGVLAWCIANAWAYGFLAKMAIAFAVLVFLYFIFG